MSPKHNALERVRVAYSLLEKAQQAAKEEAERFGQVCRESYEVGVNDREMSEGIGNKLSRARIQQYRKGDPRKARKS